MDLIFSSYFCKQIRISARPNSYDPPQNLLGSKKLQLISYLNCLDIIH